jgi:hypothetical protein
MVSWARPPYGSLSLAAKTVAKHRAKRTLKGGCVAQQKDYTGNAKAGLLPQEEVHANTQARYQLPSKTKLKKNTRVTDGKQ